MSMVFLEDPGVQAELKERLDEYPRVAYDGDPEPPWWSVEDRFVRTPLRENVFATLLKSNTMLIILFLTYLGFELSFEPSGREMQTTYIIVAFMTVHTITVLRKASPWPGVSNELIAHKINSSIFISMLLYVYAGNWVMDRDEPYNLHSLNALWLVMSEGQIVWGPIVPIIIYSMLAVLLVRKSLFGFPQDVSEVRMAPDGRSVSKLYTLIPNPMSRFVFELSTRVSYSCWDLLPTDTKDTRGSGRFILQLFSPFVLGLFYTGFRLSYWALYNIAYVSQRPSSDFMPEEYCADTAKMNAKLMVWIAFCIKSLVLRLLLVNPRILHWLVLDEATLMERQKTWVATQVGTMRLRVLWASRGLAMVFVPWSVCEKAAHTEISAALLEYLFLAGFATFFWEGLMVILLGFQEAERFCTIKTPTQTLLKHVTWLAYNSFLCPVGSLANLAGYLLNREFTGHAPMREFWGPLLNNDGDFRENVLLLMRCFTCNSAHKLGRPKTEEHQDSGADFALEALRRIRRNAGRPEMTMSTILGQPAKRVSDIQLKVFKGSGLPPRVVWESMQCECAKHVPTFPWERNTHRVDEKFHRWHSATKEEVVGLLRAPYCFTKHHEIWMFGFGSLMSPDLPPSGLTARQMKMLIPYWLHADAGYIRTWNYRHGSCNLTALGLMKAANGCGDHICGIAYPIGYLEACALFSDREDGYELLQIHEDFFVPMCQDLCMPKGIGLLWICGAPVSKCNEPDSMECGLSTCKRHWPMQETPVLQSYIDTIMSGIFFKWSLPGIGHADGMRFAAAFVTSTRGWNYAWCNDRLMLGRPWFFNRDHSLIDGILSTCPTSRTGFLNRMNPIMTGSVAMRPLLEYDRSMCDQWSDSFYNDMGFNREEEDEEKEACPTRVSLALAEDYSMQSPPAPYTEEDKSACPSPECRLEFAEETSIETPCNSPPCSPRSPRSR